MLLAKSCFELIQAVTNWREITVDRGKPLSLSMTLGFSCHFVSWFTSQYVIVAYQWTSQMLHVSWCNVFFNKHEDEQSLIKTCSQVIQTERTSLNHCVSGIKSWYYSMFQPFGNSEYSISTFQNFPLALLAVVVTIRIMLCQIWCSSCGDMTPHTLLGRYQHFGQTYCPIFKVGYSKTVILSPWLYVCVDPTHAFTGL